jgi:hypothetical protein
MRTAKVFMFCILGDAAYHIAMGRLKHGAPA